MNKLNSEDPVSLGYDAAATGNRRSEDPGSGKMNPMNGFCHTVLNPLFSSVAF